jgi:uncharacterized membrane protein
MTALTRFRSCSSLVQFFLYLSLLADSGRCFTPQRVPCRSRSPVVSQQDEISIYLSKCQRLAIPSALCAQPDGKFPEVESPDASILLSAQSDSMQQVGVIGIGAGILGGTFLIVEFLSWLQTSLPAGFFDTVLDFTVPIPLGLLYILLGATHFVYKDGYAAIVPPIGSWGGLWNVPAPGAKQLGLSNADYHVFWTGLAEIGGGILLILGGLNAIPIQIPAFLLFLLTLAVTPANVYMFTHDAQMSFGPPTPYPSGHIVRGVLQCIFLSLFWSLAFL